MAKKLQLRRGTTAQHTTTNGGFTGAVGEITVDTDKKTVVVHDGSTVGGVPLAKAADVTVLDEDNFATNSATVAPSQQSVKQYITDTSQPLDADLTNLSSCQTGAAAALASLNSNEVQILDGATLTTTELNYVDGVTSAIQTQLDAKGAGDATLAGDNTWAGAQRGQISSLTSASTITIDMSTTNNHSVTLAHNTTFANPTNQVAGQSGSIFIKQDGTGSRTAGWAAEWQFKGGADAPNLTTTAGAVDRLDYIIYEANKIHCVMTLDVK